MSQDEKFFERICEHHPSYRHEYEERRGYYLRKRAELGPRFCEWFFAEHVAIGELSGLARPLQTVRLGQVIKSH